MDFAGRTCPSLWRPWPVPEMNWSGPASERIVSRMIGKTGCFIWVSGSLPAWPDKLRQSQHPMVHQATNSLLNTLSNACSKSAWYRLYVLFPTLMRTWFAVRQQLPAQLRIIVHVVVAGWMTSVFASPTLARWLASFGPNRWTCWHFLDPFTPKSECRNIHGQIFFCEFMVWTAFKTGILYKINLRMFFQPRKYQCIVNACTLSDVRSRPWSKRRNWRAPGMNQNREVLRPVPGWQSYVRKAKGLPAPKTSQNFNPWYPSEGSVNCEIFHWPNCNFLHRQWRRRWQYHVRTIWLQIPQRYLLPLDKLNRYPAAQRYCPPPGQPYSLASSPNFWKSGIFSLGFLIVSRHIAFVFLSIFLAKSSTSSPFCKTDFNPKAFEGNFKLITGSAVQITCSQKFM